MKLITRLLLFLAAVTSVCALDDLGTLSSSPDATSSASSFAPENNSTKAT